MYMASHFQWYPSSSQNVTPWNAQFTFPEQANKAIRVATRVPPKNGPTFLQGNTIRLEFPAQGYVNPAETTLTFDVKLELTSLTAGTDWSVYFQNNIQSIFSKARLLYGSTPLEDISNVGFLVRQLTEWTNSSSFVDDQTTIAQGIGGLKHSYGINAQPQIVNARKFTHGIHALNSNPTSDMFTGRKIFPSGSATVANYYATRRYQIQFPFGIFQQGKLLPVKFMASQLAIELTLGSYDSAIMVHRYLALTGDTTPEPLVAVPIFTLSNVSLNIESFEFDASYDAMFLEGLQKGGVPLQFSTWNNYSFQQSGTLIDNIVIQEKSRSVKAIFAMLRLQAINYNDDSGATFNEINGGFVYSYQYRIGAKYFPASPVICMNETSTTKQNGACEAYIELEKCLNILGDARLSTSNTSQRWARGLGGLTGNAAYATCGGSGDGVFEFDPQSFTDDGDNSSHQVFPPMATASTFSSIFCMPTCLETTNGREISGLNAEEQSDISLMVKFSGTTVTTPRFAYEIYTYNDSMVVLRENNVLELIK